MPQYMQLMMSAPGSYGTAGSGLQTVAGQVRAVATTFRAESRRLQAEWEGADARAQEHLAGRLDRGMDQFASCLSEAAGVLDAGAAQLAAAVSELHAIVTSAQTFGTFVLPNGEAIIGPTQWSQIAAAGPAAPALQAAYQAVAAGNTAVINASVVAATMLDEEVSIQLRGVKAQLESALPFDSSSGHGVTFNYVGDTTQVSARGRLGNDLNEAWCLFNGHTVVASELQINPSASVSTDYMKADRVTLGPDDQYHVFEVKTGAASLSDAQQNLLPRLQGDGAIHPYIPGTPTAQFAGLDDLTLDRGQIGSVQVQRWDIDSMPHSARVALRTNPVSDVLAGNAGADARNALRTWMQSPGAYTLSPV